ncbi:MAG: metal ABC transporter permease [Verrucomicrobiota bacterium]|nr:metal ABC transporter permease [Verrucomicrobiota bacterium]
MEIFEVMKWPMVACLLLPGLLVYLGLHIIRREIIFVDLALAQVAALGTCLAILLDQHDLFFEMPLPGLAPFKIFYSYLWSFSFTIVGAAIFTLTRSQKQHQRVPQEALIGIVYVVAAAAGILLLSRSANGKEELQQTLVGDLLNLQRPAQVFKPFALFVFVGLIHFIFRKKFLALSFDPALEAERKISVFWWDFLFYALFGLVVTTFVEIGGVLLVFSYLIVPAVCANFLASRMKTMMMIGWAIATLGSGVGLYSSYKFDLPTGAAVVCALAGFLLLTGLLAKCFKKSL